MTARAARTAIELYGSPSALALLQHVADMATAICEAVEADTLQEALQRVRVLKRLAAEKRPKRAQRGAQRTFGEAWSGGTRGREEIAARRLANGARVDITVASLNAWRSRFAVNEQRRGCEGEAWTQAH